MRRALCAVLATAAMIALANEASAGATMPLASIPLLASPTPLKNKQPANIPGLSLKTRTLGTQKTKWYQLEIATSAGYCATDTNGAAVWMSGEGASENGEPRDFDLARLHDEGDKTLFERTRIHFDPKTVETTQLSRLEVELKEVARGPSGVVVYAYRDRGHVMILARHANAGRESRTLDRNSNEDGFALMEGCTFGGARLDASKPQNGALAALSVELPPAKGTKTPETFVIDASLTKFSRDPEPTLAVRIRRSQERGDP